MAAKVAVVRFPGTNCEFDVVEAVTSLGGQAEIVFHDQTSLGGADAVVVAGGFAHGDYLRPGAIVKQLDLRKPIYRQTAAYGHFGRNEPDFTWEKTDKAAALKAAAGLK